MSNIPAILSKLLVAHWRGGIPESGIYHILARKLAISRHSQRLIHCRGGITSTHVGFIKRGQLTIFCFVIESGQEPCLDLADIALAVSEGRPCIMLICRTQGAHAPALPYPSLIDIEGYSQPALEAAANLMYGDASSQSPHTDGQIKRESG